MRAYCFNPGLIVGTNFFRDQNPVFTKLFDLAATDLFKVGETPQYGGGCLAYMATSSLEALSGNDNNNNNNNIAGGGGGLYYSSPPGSAAKYGDAAYGNQFTVTPVSREAQDDEKAKRLWELSERALGITA